MATPIPVTAVATVAFLFVIGVLRYNGVDWTGARIESSQLSALDIRQTGSSYTGRAKGRSTAEVWGKDTMYVALCLAVKGEQIAVAFRTHWQAW